MRILTATYTLPDCEECGRTAAGSHIVTANRNDVQQVCAVCAPHARLTAQLARRAVVREGVPA
jgi:ribosome-binding protein aMBF1 (putative translation factor)